MKEGKKKVLSTKYAYRVFNMLYTCYLSNSNKMEKINIVPMSYIFNCFLPYNVE